MRLRASARAGGNDGVAHLHRAGTRTVLSLIARAPISPLRVAVGSSAAGSAQQRMCVCRYLIRGKRDRFTSTRFREYEAVTDMQRQPAT